MTTITVTPGDNLQQILDEIATPAVVYLREGIYRRKIKISRPDIKIVGEKRETTIITWDDYAKKPHPDGLEYNTFRTYTVCVTGENVRLENFTIENSNTDQAKAGQCVALSVNAKRFLAGNMLLKSLQDTLFLAPFPDDLVARYSGVTPEGYYDGFIPRDELYMQGGSLAYFSDCEIRGTVDFIFGCAEAYFEKCRVVSLNDGRKTGFIAAPSHSLKQERGFLFYDCDLICGGAAEGSVYLARPWRDFGKCAFINCRADSHISPALFDKWNDTYRDKTARFEYCNLQCSGAIAPVVWCNELTKAQAEGYIAAMYAAKRELNA